MGLRRRARINRIMGLLMLESGAKIADKKLVIQAARMVLTKGYKPNLDRLEDPAQELKKAYEAGNTLVTGVR
jgi:hypothetical protein